MTAAPTRSGAGSRRRSVGAAQDSVRWLGHSNAGLGGSRRLRQQRDNAFVSDAARVRSPGKFARRRAAPDLTCIKQMASGVCYPVISQETGKMPGWFRGRSIRVWLVAALFLFAQALAARPLEMEVCSHDFSQASRFGNAHGEQAPDQNHAARVQCCQPACAVCLGILPAFDSALTCRDPALPQPALLPVHDGVSIPPILAPPKHIL